MRHTSILAVTSLFAASIAAASFGPSTVANAAHKMSAAHKKPAAANSALVKQGQAISERDGCNRCHGANYRGKPGMSPNISSTGEMKHYSLAQFTKMMSDGTTDDGGKVKPPMPVYHASASESKALYAFLKTKK